MGQGRLTTHVLDTARGKPAAGVRIQLFRLTGMKHAKIAEAVTNADGRTDAPMLAGAGLVAGVYELVFFATFRRHKRRAGRRKGLSWII